MRRWGPIAAVALAVFALPFACEAATLTAPGGFSANYTAAAGETNNLTVSQSGGSYVFTDAPGITITPTAPCTAVANVGTCPVVGTAGSVGVSLGNMNDQARADPTLTGPLSSFGVVGGDGNDTLTGSDHAQTGLTGDDLVAGDDTLIAGAAPAQLTGGGGADTLTGGPGPDSLSPGQGNDTVDGGAGSDRLFADATADGADVIAGGSDIDNYELTSRTAGVSITLDGTANDGESCPGVSCEGDNVSGVENLFSGTGDDTLVGGEGPDSLSSGDGNDTLIGGGGADSLGGSAGNDTLSGDDGPDILAGSTGADTVDGGPGDDAISPVFGDAADTYSGGPGVDTLSSDGSTVALRISLDGVADDGLIVLPADAELDNAAADIENASGGTADDQLIGNDSDNELLGGSGNDAITSGAGLDAIDGQRGDDTLDAGPGTDSLRGDAGSDVLRSRDGERDQIDCGSSADSVIADGADEPEPSCESVSDGIEIGASAKASAKKVQLELTCPAAEGIDCEVKAKLVAKGKTLAKGKATIASGQTEKVALKLSDDGAKALNGPGKVHALASASFLDATGATLVTKAKVVGG
jgi:Ca2+-binding RTX toxin-like protein